MDECVKKTSALAGDYYMLKCTSAPSVIVECGFLSNADDERLLIAKTYQKAVAYAIFAGVLTFFA
jgi:N-acetylmuramoyl-L-alanine amidase